MVGAIRLSKHTDASTSPEVQEEMIVKTGERVGGTFVGWAKDTDVSALKTTPWEREELGVWLNDPGSWDVMIWQRMDRAVRSMADMADLGRYAKQRKKRLIFASGPGGDMLELDFASPMSELIMLILAFAAQLEGQTIMERNQGAAAHLQSIGRWSGGTIPYGFMLVRKVFSDGNEGWWLTEHEETARIRRSAIARIIAERTYAEVFRWLSESGAVTPKNHQARLAGREEDPDDKWSQTTVHEMLNSPIVRGYLVKRDGTLVRHSDGSPVLHADPIVDDATWFQLQDALRRLAVDRRPRRKDANELLGVVVCATCGKNMHAASYKSKGETRHTLRCFGSEHSKGDPAFSILKRPVLDFTEEKFLAHMGPFRRTQVVHTAGIDHGAEIEELTETVTEMSGRLARLRGPAADAVEGQIQGISDRLERLIAEPVIPPREEVVELDTTWSDDWHADDDWGRRRLILLEAGVRVTVSRGHRWTRKENRMTFELATHIDPERDALEDIIHQEST